jgi:proline iminopeptidase
MMDLGGNLAVWCELGDKDQLNALALSREYPWMVLHGGPGDSLGALHIEPLQNAGIPWFGFDQRNSGLSEDLDLSMIDLQLFVDDALEIADRLGIEKFHILGGSWGGTLALAIAAYRPNRTASLLLRAPFIPLRSRVDNFFESLEQIAPDYFASNFGRGARTEAVCECFDLASPEDLLALSIVWNRLEFALMTGLPFQSGVRRPVYTDLQELAMVRKYRLQTHFLKHDFFLNQADWNQLISKLSEAHWPLSIIQGENDRICPPDGGRMIAGMISRIKLTNLQNTGHSLTESQMLIALSREAYRQHLLT